MWHGDGRVTAVPVHKGETLGPGLILRILRDVEMSRSNSRTCSGSANPAGHVLSSRVFHVEQVRKFTKAHRFQVG